MLRVLSYRLFPSPTQSARLFHFLKIGRTLYNHALEQRITHYRDTGETLSNFTQTKDLTQLRAVSIVLADVPVRIERDALRRLDTAFQAFFRRCEEGDAKPGFPRFKSANRWNSFSVSEPGNILRGNRVRISGVEGTIRARNVRPPEGKVKQLRIVHRAGKWFAQLTVDNGQQPPAKVPVVSAVGIDVGLESFATLSDGEKIDNPRFARKLEKKLARANRNVSRKQKGSKNRRKAVKRLQRVYAKIRDSRANFTHHLSKRIVREHQLIAVEKLNIAGMVRGRLAKSIMDAAWGQFLFQLHYKAESAGVQFVEVDPRGTSQECSGCGQTVQKSLSVRQHTCPHCGLSLHRDHNAALNILARGRRVDACGAGHEAAEKQEVLDAQQ